MDLGISGRSAILLASSRGLGRACAEALAREGVGVVVNGRGADDVDAAVDEISARYGVEVQGVVGDSSAAEVHDALLFGGGSESLPGASKPGRCDDERVRPARRKPLQTEAAVRT